MLKINIDDVKTVIGLMQGHLIALAVFLVLAVVVTIAVVKLPKAKKKLIRGNAWLAFVLAVVIIVNLILTGPVYSIVNLALGDNGDISEKSIETATDLCTQIAEEGIVLLKNDGVLPLKNTKVNTFGWSVTNPVYGGTGSGSLSGTYPTVTLLEGLTNAGITYNTDITDFYTDWRDTRPTMGMWGQDWTIPEPTQEEYEAAGIYESALNFSDTALIVISRCGGEGADLPMTYDGEDTFVDGGLWDSYGIRYSEYPDDLDASKHYLELSKGDYIISINSDAHNVIDSKTYTVDADVVYDEGRSTDQTPATNQFGFAENTKQITYLSRKDGFANYEEATAPQTFTEMSEEHKAGYYTWVNYDPTEFNNPDDVMPTTGAKNGIQLVDMRGLDYDDPKWEDFLDQLTVSDMVQMISVGGYQSIALSSIGKTQQIDCDGPASINNNFTGKGSIGFPAGVMIAATWNEELAREFGSSIGEMADEMNVSGWYAPAMNTHRSAFGGRNFEYYSEDGFLAGKMAANAVAGAKEHGVYSFIKHFALNDQELNRDYLLSTWSTEQAIREIYLKPFELAVKEGGAQAVMSSFNYIGNEYAGACNELLNNVLRGEWGFCGAVVTDYFAGNGYQDADIQIRNGGDFCLNPMESETSILDDQTSATSILAARQACKNILYTTCNSRAYAADVLNPGLPGWQIVMYVIDAVVVALLALWEFLLIRAYRNQRKITAITTEKE